MMLGSKVVKSDSKIIIYPRQAKFATTPRPGANFINILQAALELVDLH